MAYGKDLEAQVRDFAIAEHDIYVVTGPVLPKTKTITIGSNKVTVPTHYYKVVYDRTPPEKMIGFILPNDGSDKPLQERIDLIKDAECFIGLSSGLSWLAWGCKVPVVMISGFTNPINEFKTPYRVINYNACNSCWNDFKDFNLADFWHCPRLAGTDRRYECTAMITADQVIDTINNCLDIK